MKYQEILDKLRSCHIKNNKDEIDIVYYLQVYINLECVIEQLLNIYYYNRHLNFRVIIWINKNKSDYSGDSGKGLTKEDLENLNLPEWIVVYKRGFLHKIGVDFIRSGFIRTYNEYIKNLNFRYITNISQNVLFIREVDLSLIKELKKQDVEFNSFQNNQKFNYNFPNTKKYLADNNIRIVSTISWGDLFTKKNMDKIVNFFNKSPFNKGKVLDECISLARPYENFLLKTLEYHVCDTYITTNILKKYLSNSVFAYPLKEDIEKDIIEDVYIKYPKLYFDNMDIRGKNESMNPKYNIKYKNITKKDYDEVCGGETLVFSVMRIRIKLHDKVRTFIRDRMDLKKL